MLDICFYDSVAGTLMMARNLFITDDILQLNLRLNYGRLSGDIIATQERIVADNFLCSYPNMSEEELESYYTEGLQYARQRVQYLEEKLKGGQPFRVWVSQTALDRCNLCWLCHFSKPYQPKILVVTCPGYEFDPTENCYVENRNWVNFTNTQFMAECAKTAIELTEEEIKHYAQIWERLVCQDAPLRLLVDDTLVSADADFFDAMILQYIHSDPQPQCLLLGDFLSEYPYLDVDFICSRIDYLLQAHVIKVCEDIVDSQGCCWQRTLSKA